MRKLITVGLFAALIVPVVRADDDKKDSIEGTYKVVEMTVEGKPSPKAEAVESVVITGDTITVRVTRGEKTREEPAKYKLDPSKSPKHIDIMPPNGGAKTIKGIYETKKTDKGLMLTIAFAPGNEDERPKDLKGEGDDAMVMKLLRKE